MRSQEFHSFSPVIRVAALLLAIVPPVALPAQTSQARQSVFLREVRIDSILLVFGADSSRIRAAALSAIRDAGRLAFDTTGPALDIDVAVPRSPFEGVFDPRGYIRVEVGRNLVERGRARTVLWQGTFDLPAVPTWREFSRSALPEVVRAVNNYLLHVARGG